MATVFLNNQGSSEEVVFTKLSSSGRKNNLFSLIMLYNVSDNIRVWHTTLKSLAASAEGVNVLVVFLLCRVGTKECISDVEAQNLASL